MGIDIGNLLTKVAILDGDELLASGTMDTTGNVATEIDGLIARVLSDAGLTPEDIGATAFTGGNAELVDGRGVVEDAVTCVAAAGAYYLPDVNLVVDIGGQSITSILLDADGDVINFMRNDKCASGSGRFLEVMSQAIGVGVESISDAARGATGAVSISSQCGVFAESGAGQALRDRRLLHSHWRSNPRGRGGEPHQGEARGDLSRFSL
jgi:predicted CoA-substrate-specific enzyme activase